jgi:hypothetical protein
VRRTSLSVALAATLLTAFSAKSDSTSRITGRAHVLDGDSIDVDALALRAGRSFLLLRLEPVRGAQRSPESRYSRPVSEAGSPRGNHSVTIVGREARWALLRFRMDAISVGARLKEAGFGFMGRSRRVWMVLDVYTAADGQQHARIGAADDPTCRKTLAVSVLRSSSRYTPVGETTSVQNGTDRAA